MDNLTEILKRPFIDKLNVIGLDLVKHIKAYLNYREIKASGELINSVKYRISEVTAFNLSLQIVALEYFEYIESGRKPGKFVPILPLSRWMEEKGIDIKYLYPINYNIYKYGIKPKPIIENVLVENKKVYLSELKIEYNKALKDYIKNNIKK